MCNTGLIPEHTGAIPMNRFPACLPVRLPCGWNFAGVGIPSQRTRREVREVIQCH